MISKWKGTKTKYVSNLKKNIFVSTLFPKGPYGVSTWLNFHSENIKRNKFSMNKSVTLHGTNLQHIH